MTAKATRRATPASRIDRTMVDRASALLELCKPRKLMLGTAESCTGGLLAAVLTDAAGASQVFEGGFVTYSNRAKHTLLDVPQDLLDSHGAVSAEVARAMAEGVLARTTADVSAAVTGIAGPGGGTAEKPVGLVHFGAARRGGGTVHVEKRFGDLGRPEIRRRSVLQALKMMEELARECPVKDGDQTP